MSKPPGALATDVQGHVAANHGAVGQAYAGVEAGRVRTGGDNLFTV